MTAISTQATGEAAAREAALRDAGRSFLVALRSRDWERFGSLLHPRARMRALLSEGHFDFSSREEILAAFHGWYGDAQQFEPLSASVTIVGERLGVRYRFRARRPDADGPEEIAQQVYFQVRRGRILSLDLICSGFRPARAATARPRATQQRVTAAAGA
jgi:hypothetical protein